MVGSYPVNLRKSSASWNAVAVVLYVWDWIPVRDGPSVKSSGPRIVDFRHETTTTGPRRVWRCRPATWCRTRLWLQPRGLVPECVCGRLQVVGCCEDVKLFVCWIFGRSLLACSAPGILPVGSLLPCLQRWLLHWELIMVRWDLARIAMRPRHASVCSCSRRGVHCVRAVPPQLWVGPRQLSRNATSIRGVVQISCSLKSIHRWRWWSHLLPIVCSLCAPCDPAVA